MEKLKVLVVDHSVINRKNITDLVNSTEYGVVTRSASGGEIAIEWLQQSHFDVILMDVYVVKEIGLGRVHSIKKEYPSTEIIVMSDNDPESAVITLESMDMGARDFILRPNGKSYGKICMSVKSELEAIFTQIMVQQYLPKVKNGENEKNAEKVITSKKKYLGDVDLVLITSSTGGPVALEMICKQIPADFTKPILIVQHMPPEFTHVLAASLNKKFKTTVIEGKSGDVVKPGNIIIAPGGFHMVLDEVSGKTASIRLLETPFVNGVRPSADVLFQSVAKAYKGKNIIVVVLTGMGNDGTKGIKTLKEDCNCYCITQSEKTCVVYGMPKCVYDAGLSDEVINLNDIAFRICQITQNRGA